MYNANTIEDLERLKARLLDNVKILDQTIQLIKTMSSSSPDFLMVHPSGTIAMGEIKHYGGGNGISNKYANYDRSKGYKQKLAAVLKTEERFMNIREISEVICSLEPGLNINEVKNAVGGAKSILLKENAIVKYKVGNSNNNSFYGSKNWLDENGEPKPEHMYREEALVTTKEEIEI